MSWFWINSRNMFLLTFQRSRSREVANLPRSRSSFRQRGGKLGEENRRSTDGQIQRRSFLVVVWLRSFLPAASWARCWSLLVMRSKKEEQWIVPGRLLIARGSTLTFCYGAGLNKLICKCSPSHDFLATQNSWWPRLYETCTAYSLASNTSSTAQGGGGSFKNRKPIGELGCCEWGMAERSHWWTERCLRSPLFLSLSLTIYLPTSLSSMYLSIYRSIYLSLSLFYLITYLPIYLSIYLSTHLSIYLSLSPFICLSV